MITINILFRINIFDNNQFYKKKNKNLYIYIYKTKKNTLMCVIISSIKKIYIKFFLYIIISFLFLSNR